MSSFKFGDNAFIVGAYGTLGRPRKGFYTPSPPPRISNSPTLFFGDIGSFTVSIFNLLLLHTMILFILLWITVLCCIYRQSLWLIRTYLGY